VNPADLLSGAIHLIKRQPGKPKQADLKRALSSIYYAMFHTLAKCCADLMIGGQSADRSKHAWRQVYRALEHNFVKTQCMNQKVISKFPKEIEDFANAFVSSQVKRHSADYDPHYRVTKTEVLFEHAAVDEAIKKFNAVTIKDRRAFAAFVLLKNRS
jgi:uncharacterized protein (UPF0332 family)